VHYRVFTGCSLSYLWLVFYYCRC